MEHKQRGEEEEMGKRMLPGLRGTAGAVPDAGQAPPSAVNGGSDTGGGLVEHHGEEEALGW